jgi:hypothetical protein
MADDAQPYGIGSDTWPGLAKLMEEMGELQQLLGKVMACSGPNAIYWDGSSLLPKIIEEMGDVRASMIFFAEVNLIPKSSIHERADMKLEKFRYWHQQYSTTKIYHAPTEGTGYCPRCGLNVTDAGPGHWVTSALEKVNCS